MQQVGRKKRLWSQKAGQRLQWHLVESYKFCWPLYRVLFSTWPIISRPTLQSDFITLSEGYYHCDRLSSSRHRLLNVSNTLPTTQCRQSVGPAFFCQTGKNNTPYLGIWWLSFSSCLVKPNWHTAKMSPCVFFVVGKIPCPRVQLSSICKT